jgi:hypothetical protein
MKPVKTARALVIVGLVVAIGSIVARVVVRKRQSAQAAQPLVERVAALEQQRNPTPPAVTATRSDPAPAEQASNISESAPPQMTNVDAPQKVVPKSTPTRKPKEPRQDPLAREAMALVGVDPEAEAYWFEAINDPSLSDNEREDLIEDLNENGFSSDNGRRATIEDLPLIAMRLRIVEELWPHAMDQNNWNAFQEVHKDLSNMLVRLTQR